MYIISGMHRSGTSLVARLFFVAGADMGDPAKFYRPDKWNPEGYFEQPDIHAINMPLINGPWGRLAYFKLPSTGTIMRRATRIRDQIRRTADAYRDKLVKETRFCLTLPAWLAYGAEPRGLLICLREPAAVARSIQARNHTTAGHAYRLWLVHNQRLLASAADLPVRFINYDRLLDPAAFVEEMRPAYRFVGFERSDEQIESLRRANVKPQMNHHPDSDARYPDQVQKLWRRLLDRHRSQSGWPAPRPGESRAT